MKLTAIQTKTLSKLLDQYEKSATFAGTNKVRQSFGLNVEKVFPRYMDDADYDYYVSFNEDMKEITDLGWVELTEANRRITRIILKKDAIYDIYSALERVPRKEMQTELLLLFDELEKSIQERSGEDRPDQYDELKGVFLSYIDAQRVRINENRTVEYFNGDMEEYRAVWRILLKLPELENEVFARDLSVRLFHDSKKLDKLSDRAESLLFEYGDYPEKEHILEEYGIIRIPTHMCVKGNIELTFGEERLSLQHMNGDIGLSAGMLASISDIKVFGRRIVTIENLTSFYRYDCGRDDIAIYLAGYHNRQKRDFLQMIYSRYPDLEYYHFGDIDAGGYYIYEHLRKKTGIPFQTMKMDADTILKYEDYSKKLTLNDRKRIMKLIEYYKNISEPDSRVSNIIETLELMLEKGIKLEQEALDA